jgi:Ca-activated chloride channel family protein
LAAASLFVVFSLALFRTTERLEWSEFANHAPVLKGPATPPSPPPGQPKTLASRPNERLTQDKNRAASSSALSSRRESGVIVGQLGNPALVAPPVFPAAKPVMTGGMGGGVVGGMPAGIPFQTTAMSGRKLNGTLSFLHAQQVPGDWERPPQPLSEKERYEHRFNTEAYDRVVDNPFLQVGQNPLSTFSIDVDTAAYANLRRFLTNGMLPPKDAVRIEEMVNYFSYDYPGPKGKEPFSAQVEVAQAPWDLEHRLVRIGLKGREIALDKRPPSNLVFLIDVSGSMEPPNKLPLVKKGLQLLVEKLNENDRIAIVVYAGASGLALPSTPCEQKSRILAALDNLDAGGSTNGGAGVQLAYDTAVANFIKGGTNRVILATDGDFNVGTTNQGDLIRLIEEKAKSGVFLSVLGFGMGNYKDSMLEKLADKGNGNYAYIDSLNEARKVLVEQMAGTLLTIAKDVKTQIEFNPALVGAYRLIGYENRLLRAEDFNDDTKDAGEIGAGHVVTALYELVPAGKEMNLPGVDPLKYQKPVQTTREAKSDELLTLKLRYKEPDGDTSKLLQFPVTDRGSSWTSASRDFKFASAVAAFGMILRDSPYKGKSTLGGVLELAESGKGHDKEGYRAEFINLVNKARALVEGKSITQ